LHNFGKHWVGPVQGTDLALREQSEAYGGEFASENEVLTPQNTIPWQEKAETAET